MNNRTIMVDGRWENHSINCVCDACLAVNGEEWRQIHELAYDADRGCCCCFADEEFWECQG